MLVVQICVGSSCHIKGSQEIVSLMQKAVEEYNLDGDVVLVGSFCIGKCNREGVTVQINDDIHVGITPQNFKEFFHMRNAHHTAVTITDFVPHVPKLNTRILGVFLGEFVHHFIVFFGKSMVV